MDYETKFCLKIMLTTLSTITDPGVQHALVYNCEEPITMTFAWSQVILKENVLSKLFIDNACTLDAILKEKRKHGFGQMHVLEAHPPTIIYAIF